MIVIIKYWLHTVTEVENKFIVTKGEGRSGMNWEDGIDNIHTIDTTYRQLMRTYCTAQGTLLSAVVT